MPETSRRLAALVEAGMILSSELDLDALLQRIADISRDVVGAEYGAVGVVDESGMLTRFVYSGIGKQQADEIGSLPTGVGVLGAIIEEGRPIRLKEISQHPRSYGFPEGHPPMHTFLGAPIVVGGRVFGRLYLTEKSGGEEFTKDDERIALTLASQAGVAIENAALHDEVATRQSEMAIFEERDRISKELHDGVIQSIYSVGLSLQGSLSILERDAEAARRRIDAAIAELDNVVRDVRSYIFELQPKIVEEKGLTDAIKELVRDHEVNTLAHTEVHLHEDACGTLDRSQEGHVIQVVREVLSNIARHAEASTVTVNCAREQSDIVLEIVDNGKGFDPAKVARGQGLGNIEDRAAKLGGTMTIGPAVNGGTIHRLRIPERNG